VLAANSNFDVKLEWARVAEIRVSDFLRERGWWVLPTYDFSGVGDNKAPKLMAPAGKSDLVMPDLQCFKDGKPRWFEVKRKSNADQYRIGGYLVTGIDHGHYVQYKQVEKVTDSQVVLVFVHEKEQEVRGATLSWLDANARSHYSDRMGRYGMDFWKYEKITLWSAANGNEVES
jgi:hypothetical protein